VGERYPPIGSYAMLSDTHTAALVGEDLAVDWLCVPRFDSPSVFGALLDRRRGGALRLGVEGGRTVHREYLGQSLVLSSRVAATGGEVVVTDALVLEEGPDEERLVAGHRLVRHVRVTAGAVDLTLEVDARPDYARARAGWRLAADGQAQLSPDGGAPIAVTASRADLLAVAGGSNEVLQGQLHLAAGEEVALVVAWRSGAPARLTLEAARAMVERTQRIWRDWSDRSGYDGVAVELVHRSAVVLRALSYDESGALVAAPTTSLPEWIGGTRNWDYRFTWHRDASLVVLALYRLGHGATGRRYLRFLLDLAPVRGGSLPPMAGIGGETEGTELELDHLEGYARSVPVRVGNEAFEQYQLDSFGHVLDAAFVTHELGGLEPGQWEVLRPLVDIVADTWREPDHGIWEMRTQLRHHVNSKVMAWVCLDRGVRLAQALDSSVDVTGWEQARDEVHADVLAKGYDADRGAFTMAYDGDELDASVLAIPLTGFLPGDDPRVVSTLDVLMRELALRPDLDPPDPLIRRYDTEVVDDGVGGKEGAFLLSSFHLVAALVLAGRMDEARRRFDHLCSLAGPLGLFAEQAGPDGRMLGNFPQAFTHLALVEAALNIDSALRLDTAERQEALHDWAAQHRRS
jgi:alpha,alpha-trehalase